MQTQRQLDQYDRISLNLKENTAILSQDNVFENGVYKMSALCSGLNVNHTRGFDGFFSLQVQTICWANITLVGEVNVL